MHRLGYLKDIQERRLSDAEEDVDVVSTDMSFLSQVGLEISMFIVVGIHIAEQNVAQKTTYRSSRARNHGRSTDRHPRILNPETTNWSAMSVTSSYPAPGDAPRCDLQDSGARASRRMLKDVLRKAVQVLIAAPVKAPGGRRWHWRYGFVPADASGKSRRGQGG